jgi:hypothetical protein
VFNALRPFNAAIFRVKELNIKMMICDRPHAMLWLLSAAVYGSQIWSTLRFLEQDNVFSNSLQAGRNYDLLKRILGIYILLLTDVCFENARRNSCNFIGSGQLSNSETGWFK